METTTITRALRVAGLAGMALVLVRCGDGDVDFIPGNVDPTPGTFVGAIDDGGVVTVVVGSVEAITLVCDGQTSGGACSPVVQVVDGRATGTCGGLSFDLTFVSNDSLVIDDLSAGTTCDGGGSADRTSQPGPTPTPTATPAVVPTETPTATQQGAGETPTPTPTPDGGGATCDDGDSVTVLLALDSGGVDLAGAQITLDYPASLEIPGSIDAPSVAERVTIIPNVGFTSVNDEDTQPDGVDDRLNISVVSGAAFPDGDFAEIEFDCLAGATVPAAGSFACTADGSDEFGGLVTTICVLSVTGP